MNVKTWMRLKFTKDITSGKTTHHLWSECNDGCRVTSVWYRCFTVTWQVISLILSFSSVSYWQYIAHHQATICYVTSPDTQQPNSKSMLSLHYNKTTIIHPLTSRISPLSLKHIWRSVRFYEKFTMKCQWEKLSSSAKWLITSNT